MAQSKAVQNLIYAQLSFFGGLAIAVLLTTAGFTDNHGLSFYGVHYPTVVPFGLGLLLCNLFLLRAASELPVKQHPFEMLQPFLRILAALLLVILLTPDTFGKVFYFIHVAAATLLFILELAVAIWMAWRWNGDKLTWGLLVIQSAAGIVAMLSMFHATHYLSHSSLVFQLVFGILLIWSISQLIEHVKRAE